MNPIDESVRLMIDAWKTFVGRMLALANVELPFLNTCFHDSAMTARQGGRLPALRGDGLPLTGALHGDQRATRWLSR